MSNNPTAFKKKSLNQQTRKNIEENITRFVSVKQLSQLYPAFSELSLRWILFHRETNGASSFVTRVGKKKLIINVEKFEAWLQQQERI